uniref:Uncharacterized protein n=1 Tax=Anopheles atroparvus TaxID=41427 RepID=A0AAG5DSZ9_ANOAO
CISACIFSSLSTSEVFSVSQNVGVTVCSFSRCGCIGNGVCLSLLVLVIDRIFTINAWFSGQSLEFYFKDFSCSDAKVILDRASAPTLYFPGTYSTSTSNSSRPNLILINFDVGFFILNKKTRGQ